MPNKKFANILSYFTKFNANYIFPWLAWEGG